MGLWALRCKSVAVVRISVAVVVRRLVTIQLYIISNLHVYVDYLITGVLLFPLTSLDGYKLSRGFSIYSGNLTIIKFDTVLMKYSDVIPP